LVIYQESLHDARSTKYKIYKDFLFDCIPKMTEAADRKKKEGNADDESLTLVSTVGTLPSRKGPTVTDAKWLKNS